MTNINQLKLKKLSYLKEKKKRKARKSLSAFILYLRPYYKTSDFFYTCCKTIDKCIEDLLELERSLQLYTSEEIDKLYAEGKIKIPRLILQAPPRHGKSDIVSRFLPAYFLGRFPHFKIRALSGGDGLATSNNIDVQKIMFSAEFTELFGDLLNPNRSVTKEFEARRNMDTFEITKDNKVLGSYSCATVGGNIMGTGANLIILDDPIKNDEMANSQTQKDKLETWFYNTALSRLELPCIVIVMHQRWSPDDLCGRILAKEPHLWINLKFKAIQDDGTALIPEHIPLFRLLEAKASMSNFEAMYQQEPVIRGGNIIKTNYFKRYDHLPRFALNYIVMDTASKAKANNDYSVMQFWGKTHEGDYYLIDQIRKKLWGSELLKTAKDFYHAYRAKYQIQAFYIEDKASGPTVMDMLKQDRIPVSELKARKDKYYRVQDILHIIESGFVFIPKDKDWVLEFERECENFTGSNADKHDDQVDCLSYALSNQIKTIQLSNGMSKIAAEILGV